ncbi:MAG: glycoside hydrolase family 99-like domain-containing protein [Lentisphaeria bacterium]|nr:glycoside hydrolase family 99-like domain-containing protein [Lentisphaeria bacterium]
MIRFTIAAVVACGTACSFAGVAAGQPVAWYAFDVAETLGKDSGSAGVEVSVAGGRAVPGRVGSALALDGSGGFEIPDRPDLRTDGPFTIELWIRFAVVDQFFGILAKPDEYLLRLDPLAEGGHLSFFVCADGRWEPRVRGPRPVPDVWYHVLASWDGGVARLCVDGRESTSVRSGGIASTGNPILVGKGWKHGPVPFAGLIDELKITTGVVSAGTAARQRYGVDDRLGLPPVSRADFDFADSAQGWMAADAGPGGSRAGAWVVEVEGGAGVLLSPCLDLPAAQREFVSVVFSATAGNEGRLWLVGREADEIIPFALRADGQPHHYAIDVRTSPVRDAGPFVVGLFPSDTAAQVGLSRVQVGERPLGRAEVEIRGLDPEKPLNRAGRVTPVVAAVRNHGGRQEGLHARLTASAPVRIRGDVLRPLPPLEHGEEISLRWEIESEAAGEAEVRLVVEGEDTAAVTAVLALEFLPPLSITPGYLPEPVPARSPVWIGAHHCPLWEADKPGMWTQVLRYPERTPALGLYAQDNPEVADWETTWAVEHGVSFFVYCWYRSSQGGPVTTRFASAIHDALFRSRYRDRMKFTIMWENQSRGRAGVADEQDLMVNLLPFWMENYFRHPSYMVLDGKPLLFIYRPEFLVSDLGSVENVRAAFGKMREACVEAGFRGLYLLGEYRGTDPKHLEQMKDLGLDYTFAYCWPVAGNPTPERAIRAQLDAIRRTRELKILPQVITVTQGWTGWHNEGSVWRLPPADWQRLLEEAKAILATYPPGELGGRVLLLDNWNEWGEGHYLAPHRQYGFGYLDAVRAVFTDAPAEHTDLIPEDLGMGPYDTAVRGYYRQREELRALLSLRVTKGERREPGLIGWWAFDEAGDSPLASDYAGNGLGGHVEGASRAPGFDGGALVCAGGCVVIESHRLLAPRQGMTLEAWVRTDTPGQSDRWFVNRIFGGNTASGYRMGLSQGRPCFAVPVSDWSHHLVGEEPLPVGRWVHLAGTCDGTALRLYMDGRECGSMPRAGEVRPNAFHLCLGNFEIGHAAHFQGLLDEVRLYNRALSAEEVRVRASAGAR